MLPGVCELLDECGLSVGFGLEACGERGDFPAGGFEGGTVGGVGSLLRLEGGEFALHLVQPDGEIGGAGLGLGGLLLEELQLLGCGRGAVFRLHLGKKALHSVAVGAEGVEVGLHLGEAGVEFVAFAAEFLRGGRGAFGGEFALQGLELEAGAGKLARHLLLGLGRAAGSGLGFGAGGARARAGRGGRGQGSGTGWTGRGRSGRCRRLGAGGRLRSCRRRRCGRGRRTETEGGAPVGEGGAGAFECGAVERTDEGLEVLAPGAVLDGERKPDEGLDIVLGDAASLGVGEAEVVLGDGVAALGLGAEGGDFGGFLGGERDEADGGQRQHADKAGWVHGNKRGGPALLSRGGAAASLRNGKKPGPGGIRL